MRNPDKFDGKRGLTKDPRLAINSRTITVACGKCIGCRLARAHEWSLRCIHEVQTSGPSSFVTLTYDDEHLPADRGLHYRDFQLFMHKLRKRQPGAGRFLMCGEYGDQFGRPHFHAILFNCVFSDQVLYKRAPDELYTSVKLSALWGHGFCTVGPVTLQSAGYVARYSTKKVHGPHAGGMYQYLDPETGEIFDRRPPFLESSTQPGIGYEWFQRYHSDVFPCDYLVHDGVKFPVPRYYTKLMERLDVASHQRILRKRRASTRASHDKPDNSPRRLHDRGEVELLKSETFNRDRIR